MCVCARANQLEYVHPSVCPKRLDSLYLHYSMSILDIDFCVYYYEAQHRNPFAFVEFNSSFRCAVPCVVEPP